MRQTTILLITVLALSISGCSHLSTSEREEFIAIEAREDYIKLHPDCDYKKQIKSGEITRGMSIYEVIASWGLPNVYLLTEEGPLERCVYYTRDPDSRLLLIYNLTFEESLLKDWEIDAKRFVDQRVVFDVTVPELTPVRATQRKIR